ncbi:MAG: hypothetical protein IJ198_10235 [Lachnospiraceae bacterium]|nr:hypothetical protein [Lachnospiraceae bacterium]
MKSNAFEQLTLFVTIALLTIPLLISCKKTSSSEEIQKENAALSNSAVQTEQLNENASKDEEILVIINGAQVNLGELTLENLLQKSGLTSEYTVETVGKNNPKVREALKTELIDERKDIRIYAEIEKEKGDKESGLKNGTVCGLTIEKPATGSEKGKGDSVSIGGVFLGDSEDDVKKAFGSPDFSDSYGDGYGTNYRFKKNKKYDLSVDLYRSEVSRIEIRRLPTEELNLFEAFNSRWDESDKTRKATLKSLSLRVPYNSRIINNSILIGDSVQCKISRSNRDNVTENSTDEADLYRECFWDLIDTRFRANVEYEKGYVDGNPAVYFNHKYNDEKDGKEYFHSGAVFVTDYYVYWYSYTTLAEDENSRLTANKILSSIKVKRPIFKK